MMFAFSATTFAAEPVNNNHDIRLNTAPTDFYGESSDVIINDESTYTHNIDGQSHDIRLNSAPENYLANGQRSTSSDVAVPNISENNIGIPNVLRALMPTGGDEYPYNPTYWNDSDMVYRANCYGYVLNRIATDTSDPYAGYLFQPGYKTGNLYESLTKSDIIDEKSSFEDNSDDFVFYIHFVPAFGDDLSRQFTFTSGNVLLPFSVDDGFDAEIMPRVFNEVDFRNPKTIFRFVRFDKGRKVVVHGCANGRRNQFGEVLLDAVFPIFVYLILGGIVIEMTDGNTDLIDYLFRILYAVLLGKPTDLAMSLQGREEVLDRAYLYSLKSAFLLRRPLSLKLLMERYPILSE